MITVKDLQSNGVEITVNNIKLLIVNVAGQFTGLSLTEQDGLNMRRVSVELKGPESIGALRSIRNFCTAQIERLDPNP